MLKDYSSIDWITLRKHFPILEQTIQGHPLIYFDNAASSHKPLVVLEAITHYYTHNHANVHRGLHELSNRATSAYESARQQVAKFLNAKNSSEIIFTRGTTEGINLVANTWAQQELQQGDVILLTEMEHHSNLVPWQMLAQRKQLTLRFIPITPQGDLDLTQLPELLDKRVRLLVFPHISNSLGTLNPVKELCAAAHQVHAKVLLDAAQSAGHLPIDVIDLDVDFLALSGHKMCAPTGIGALYVKKTLLDQMPPWHGGGEMIDRVSYDCSVYKEAPYRFEAGTPNIAGAIGLAAATQYLDQIGRNNIHQRLTELTTHARTVLSSLNNIKILSPHEASSLISFNFADLHPHDLTTYADRYGLALRGGHHCTQPLMRKLGLSGSTRASFAFYNTHEEIDRMGEILHQAQHFFA